MKKWSVTRLCSLAHCLCRWRLCRLTRYFSEWWMFERGWSGRRLAVRLKLESSFYFHSVEMSVLDVASNRRTANIVSKSAYRCTPNNDKTPALILMWDIWNDRTPCFATLEAMMVLCAGQANDTFWMVEINRTVSCLVAENTVDKYMIVCICK